MDHTINHVKNKCTHPHHFFDHPFCKQQSLTKRVAQVAFHVLTLCLPLVIYKLYQHFSVKKNVEVPKAANIQELAIASGRAVAPKPVEEEKPQVFAKVEKPQVMLNIQQKRMQEEWGRYIDWICLGGNSLEHVYHNLFASLYRLDRDFALPITEDQLKILRNFKEGRGMQNHDVQTIEFLMKEILEVAALPVPTTPDEKWQFSINMIKRMKRQYEVLLEMMNVYREAGQIIHEDYRNLRSAFYHQFQGNMYEWLCGSHEMFKGAEFPKVKVEIPMEASTISLHGEECGSLPQTLIWDPSTGDLTAHLEFYLSGEGKRLMDINLREHANDRPQIFANQYAGCYHYWIDENDLEGEGLTKDTFEEEQKKAQEENLPWVAKLPEAVFVARDDAHPKGGMSFEVMLQMFDKLIESLLLH